MKKSELNALLKANFELDKVRIDRDTSIDGKGKARRNLEGGFIPAIYAWSHSPMDVTNVGVTKAYEKYRAISELVLAQPNAELIDRDAGYAKVRFNNGPKKEVTVILFLNRFQAYSPSRNMDHGYQDSYITVRYED